MGRPPTKLGLTILTTFLTSCAGPPERPAITQRTWSAELNLIPHGSTGPTLIRNATVVDVVGGSTVPAQDLLITADRITSQGPTGELALPGSFETIDATDLYVIPGLWDMHTHLSAWGDAGRDLGFRMLLANGVTGVRDLGGFPGFLPRWRREIEAGAVGPRLFYADKALSGPGVPWPTHLGISDEADAREAVQQSKLQGADFIKVHDSLPALVYPPLIREAKAAGLPVVGHVPRALTAKLVSDSGQKSIEHLFGIAGWWDDFFNPASIRAPEEQITPELRELFATLRDNGTWVTPTTAVLAKIIQAQDESHDGIALRRYAPHSLHPLWDRERTQIRPNVSLEDRKRYADQELAIIGAMHEAGVKLLAGSDTGGFDAAPGFELHVELQMLVKAGLTPIEALQCATYNAADFLDLLDSHGAVAEGRVADLVLLSADPTEDVANLQKIEAVIAAGELYRRDDLDRLLSTVETLASDL